MNDLNDSNDDFDLFKEDGDAIAPDLLESDDDDFQFVRQTDTNNEMSFLSNNEN